jgi:hypothetical protein
VVYFDINRHGDIYLAGGEHDINDVRRDAAGTLKSFLVQGKDYPALRVEGQYVREGRSPSGADYIGVFIAYKGDEIPMGLFLKQDIDQIEEQQAPPAAAS